MLNCWCITWPVGFKRLIQSKSNTVHNYRKHSLWCGVSLCTTNFVHFLVHKVNLQRLRPANTLPFFRIRKICTRPRTPFKWRRNPLDVCMKFQSDLVNRFISPARWNIGGPVTLCKETNHSYADSYMYINVSLSTKDLVCMYSVSHYEVPVNQLVCIFAAKFSVSKHV